MTAQTLYTETLARRFSAAGILLLALAGYKVFPIRQLMAVAASCKETIRSSLKTETVKTRETGRTVVTAVGRSLGTTKSADELHQWIGRPCDCCNRFFMPVTPSKESNAVAVGCQRRLSSQLRAAQADAQLAQTALTRLMPVGHAKIGEPQNNTSQARALLICAKSPLRMRRNSASHDRQNTTTAV